LFFSGVIICCTQRRGGLSGINSVNPDKFCEFELLLFCLIAGETRRRKRHREPYWGLGL